MELGDLVFTLVAVIFFAACVGYTYACDKL